MFVFSFAKFPLLEEGLFCFRIGFGLDKLKVLFQFLLEFSLFTQFLYYFSRFKKIPTFPKIICFYSLFLQFNYIFSPKLKYSIFSKEGIFSSLNANSLHFKFVEQNTAECFYFKRIIFGFPKLSEFRCFLYFLLVCKFKPTV